MFCNNQISWKRTINHTSFLLLPRLAKPRYLWISAKRRGGSAKAPVWLPKPQALRLSRLVGPISRTKSDKHLLSRHNWNLLHVLGLLASTLLLPGGVDEGFSSICSVKLHPGSNPQVLRPQAQAVFPRREDFEI